MQYTFLHFDDQLIHIKQGGTSLNYSRVIYLREKGQAPPVVLSRKCRFAQRSCYSHIVNSRRFDLSMCFSPHGRSILQSRPSTSQVQSPPHPPGTKSPLFPNHSHFPALHHQNLRLQLLLLLLSLLAHNLPQDILSLLFQLRE